MEWWRVDPENKVCPLTGKSKCKECKFYMRLPHSGGASYNCLIGQIGYRLEQIMRDIQGIKKKHAINTFVSEI